MKPLAVAAVLTSLSVLPALSTAPLAVTASGNKITSTEQNIRFDLSNPGHEAALTRIFNLQGEEVGVLTAQSLDRFSWDGKDVNQEPVESGMYVVQIRHHGAVWHGPVVVAH